MSRGAPDYTVFMEDAQISPTQVSLTQSGDYTTLYGTLNSPNNTDETDFLGIKLTYGAVLKAGYYQWNVTDAPNVGRLELRGMLRYIVAGSDAAYSRIALLDNLGATIYQYQQNVPGGSASLDTTIQPTINYKTASNTLYIRLSVSGSDPTPSSEVTAHLYWAKIWAAR